MKDDIHDTEKTGSITEKPNYEVPTIKVVNEEEALSAFQATAAGSHNWWTP